MELMEAEEEERATKRDQENFEKRIKKRLELIQSYHDQIMDKRARLQKEREEESIFREKVLYFFC